MIVGRCSLLTVCLLINHSLPMVISAMINVAQDLEDDWPLELIGHDGIAVNVTMQPGDMVLYESHSVLHGRPYPLRGNHCANVFVHFEPVTYSINQETVMRHETKTLSEKYQEALLQWTHYDFDSETYGPDLPSHIQEGSLEATRWRQDFVFIKDDQEKKSSSLSDIAYKTNSNTGVHINHLAAHGALQSIQKLVQTNPAVVHQADTNGWQPVHEAARAGHTKVMEYLVQNKVDLNARTNHGSGGTPLWWAEHVRERGGIQCESLVWFAS